MLLSQKLQKIKAKVRIRTGVVMLCRHLRSRSATLALGRSLSRVLLIPPPLSMWAHSEQRSCCNLSPYKDCLRRPILTPGYYSFTPGTSSIDYDLTASLGMGDFFVAHLLYPLGAVKCRVVGDGADLAYYFSMIFHVQGGYS